MEFQDMNDYAFYYIYAHVGFIIFYTYYPGSYTVTRLSKKLHVLLLVSMFFLLVVLAVAMNRCLGCTDNVKLSGNPADHQRLCHCDAVMNIFHIMSTIFFLVHCIVWKPWTRVKEIWCSPYSWCTGAILSLPFLCSMFLNVFTSVAIYGVILYPFTVRMGLVNTSATNPMITANIASFSFICMAVNTALWKRALDQEITFSELYRLTQRISIR